MAKGKDGDAKAEEKPEKAHKTTPVGITPVLFGQYTPCAYFSQAAQSPRIPRQ
jgi:hypothetical protein